MGSQVRLLPAVIGAAAVLALLRLGAMVVGEDGALSGTGMASAADAAAPAPATPDASSGTLAVSQSATTPAATPSATAPATTPSAPASAPSGDVAQAGAATASAKADDGKSACAGTYLAQAQSKGEADVMRGLSDRRGELDARENDLSLREQMLVATQKQVDEKIAELKQIQVKLDSMLAQRDDAQKVQLNALVKMYENMKPTDAAKIFEKLERHILVDVAGGMKPAKVGAVLAAMDPARAQELTALLATRLVLPEPQRLDVSAASALPATTATPAPAPDGQTPSTAPAATPPPVSTAPAG